MPFGFGITVACNLKLKKKHFQLGVFWAVSTGEDPEYEMLTKNGLGKLKHTISEIF